MRVVNEVPGVDYAPEGVQLSWFDVPAVAPLVGREVPPPPEVSAEELPGYADYVKLLKRVTPRSYQHEDAVWLANRHGAILANPMRTGKSFTTLLGAKLARKERILVLCPSVSKWVWGREVHKWLDYEALLLEGMSRTRAVRFCGTCKRSGYVNGERCPSCRQRNGSTYGYHIHEVRMTEEPPKREEGTLLRCRRHLEVWTKGPEKCPKCAAEFRATVEAAKIVVCNYDILVGKAVANKLGRRLKSTHLPGWLDVLVALPWDLVIVDESHYLRGFDTSYKRRGKLLSDRVLAITENVPTVWLVSGTPIFGRVRDLYGQLRVLTGDTQGSMPEWTGRYCEGHQGAEGWSATGSSNEEELQARLSWLMRMRPRSEVLKNMPPKQREVVYVDNDKPIRRTRKGKPMKAVPDLIDAAAPYKHDAAIERVLPELAEGLKVVMLTYRPKHAERLAKLLAKKMNSRDWRARMNSQKAEVFIGQNTKGIDTKRRERIANAYVDYAGAAVFVGTIGTLPGSISLKGATSVHMLDFSDSPSAMEQAEDRGYEPGVTGYTVTHYIVRNSIDDDLAAVVLPKFEVKDRLLADENASNVLNAFGAQEDKETMAEVMARHEAAIADDDEWM